MVQRGILGIMTKGIWIAVAVGIGVAIYVGFISVDFSRDSSISNFRECVAAGNRVGESYPRQCWTEDGRHFVEELDEPVATPFVESGTVAFVIDGDTIELTNGERVRYIGINTPEEGECYYDEATEYNRELVRGKTVTLERDTSDRDQYGRLLRYVSLTDGPTIIDVNRAMVANGYARVVYIEPDVDRYHSYRVDEGFAFQARFGIWGNCE